MKRGIVWLLAALLLVTASPLEARANAQPVTVSGREEPPLLTETPVGEGFVIDDRHLYPGMTAAYQDGYVPVISEGRARLVLPLVWQGETPPDGRRLTARLGFPDRSGSVFLGANYQRTLTETTLIVGTDTVNSYLFEYDVEINSNYSAGTYPIVVKLSYSVGGQPRQQEFTVYVALRGGSSETTAPEPTIPETTVPETTAPETIAPETTAPESGGDDALGTDPTLSGEAGMGQDSGGFSMGGGYGNVASSASPRLMVEACEVTPEECRAGSAVTLRLTIRNTSDKRKLRNIRLSYSSNTGEIFPADEAPDRYRDSLGKGESFEEVLDLKVLDSAQSVVQPLTLTLDFEDSEGTAYNSTETLYLHLVQDVELRVDTPVVPVQMEAMSRQEVSLNLFNVGTARIRNVICQVEMEGVLPSGSIYVGDVEANSTAQAVLGIVVADRTHNNPNETEKYGDVQGRILITYEDEKGRTYEAEAPLKSIITQPEGIVDETEAVEYESQWWVSLVTGLVLIQVLSLVVLWQRRRHRG